MNEVIVRIDNCLKCINCYTAPILTTDSFEHEEGAYCKLVSDRSTSGFGKNGQHKLIGSDDWHLENYTQIPNWCPLLPHQDPPQPKKLKGLYFGARLKYVSKMTGDKTMCSFVRDADDNPDEYAYVLFPSGNQISRVEHAQLEWCRR